MSESAKTDPVKVLADLGLELPTVTMPLGAYVPALQSGNYVYVSGQLPDGRRQVARDRQGRRRCDR